MGIFVRSDEHTAGKQQTGSTIIANGAKIEGTFELSTYFYVDGEVIGKINSSNTIVIGKCGFINGEMEAPKVIVNGKFDGKVTCDSLEILEGGECRGIIFSNELIMEPKSSFEGESHKRNPDEKKLITVETEED